MKSVVEILASTAAWLKERGIPSARLDAELLIGHVLGFDRVKVYLSYDRPFADDELERLRPLVRRRGNREPLAWVIGHKEFYGRDFIVTPGVLVPRPDTETLIEAALEWLPASTSSGGGGEPPATPPGTPNEGPRVLPWAAADQPAAPAEPTPAGPGKPLSDEPPVYVADIGSGTGCIGLTLALERPAVRLFAVDRSEEALAATRANVAKHGLGQRAAVLRGDLLAAIPAARTLDWIVSNPPYIPSLDIDSLQPEVRDHEPRLALDGGGDGLEVYRRLVPAAAARARHGVLFEVGAGQAAAVAALLTATGMAEVRVWKDLAGTERVVGGRRAPGLK
ncbi:MAG: HemK/PrmC family methyltransferase [Pseudomonadota bacterium]|nr:HemK/PrmC family methyltransferase [Pseudomonadota bacterium]